MKKISRIPWLIVILGFLNSLLPGFGAWVLLSTNGKKGLGVLDSEVITYSGFRLVCVLTLLTGCFLVVVRKRFGLVLISTSSGLLALGILIYKLVRVHGLSTGDFRDILLFGAISYLAIAELREPEHQA